MKSAFHLALHVTDLDETRRFHGDVLGWTEGRSTETSAARLQGGGIDFAIPPVFRFNGQPGEECTAFFRDLSGNPPEIKGLADTSGILAS